MSQLSSQAQDPTWVSIPFAKFSHDTSPYGTRKIPWVHVGARNDLDFTIRNIRAVDKQYGNYGNRNVMSITAGAELLEYQNLGELVKFTQGHNPLSGADNPVQIVIRCPVMAMRYPKTTNTVRRIQLKFHNEVDFTRAFNVLRDLGLPISDSGGSMITQSSRSPTPSFFSSASASSTSSATTSIPRSSSAIETSFRALDSTPLRRQNYTPDINFKVPIHPENSSSEARRSTSALPYLTPQITRPASNSTSSISAPPLTNKMDSFHDAARPQPPLYLSQWERESQSRRLSQPVLQQPSQNKNDQVYPSDSLYLTQMQPQLALLSKIAENPKEARAELLSASPFFQTTLQDDALRQCDFQRPCPAPALHSSDIHAFWMPPRQELPFPKPKDIGNARPSSVSDLPPLPKPTPVARVILTANPTETTHEEATKSPLPKPVSKKRVAQRRGPTTSDAQEQNDHLSSTESITTNFLTDEIVNASPEDEPSPLAAKSAAAAQPSSMSGLHSKAMAVKKRTAAPIRPPSVTKRPKMVDQSTQTQTLSGRDHTAGMKSMSTDKISDSVDKSSAFAPPVDPPESYLNHLDAFVTKLKDRPAPKELWETTGYADGDEETRSIILNDFICENLENRDFLQLCEDTENAWRRIGFGM